MAATAPLVPRALTEQLALGGRLVMPVREGNSERLLEVRRLAKDDFHSEALREVRFVPLIGAYRNQH